MDENEIMIRLQKLKKKVNFLVDKKKMYSSMNNTKWIELQKSVRELPFLPPFEMKNVTDIDEPKPFDKDVWYTGNWDDEVLLPFFNIEWIRIRPRYIRDRGRLVDGEVVDETNMFREILEKYAIPYEEVNGTFTVYGYKKI